MRRFVSALICAVLAFCGTVYVCASPDTAGREMCGVSASKAVVVEMDTGRLICGKAENERASMASTTKIMTSLLLCELTDLDKEITATGEMVWVEGTSMGLREGDKVHYRDLLYGMLLASGNDAANATALSIAGSTEKFADLMNKRAAEIGMKNTHFVTPSGLDDDEHYSTAYDMALLACEAMKNETFRKACSTASVTLEYGNPVCKHTLSNHNKLLRSYDGCIGVKTGFTKKSGRCLVSCAVRDGKGVIAVTLHASDDWNDHIRMLDYGFDQLETRTLSAPKTGSVKVIGGTKRTVKPYCDPPKVSLLPEDFDRLTCTVSTQRVAFAPVKSGEVLGTAVWKLGDTVVAVSQITVNEEVRLRYDGDRRDIVYWLRRMISA